MKDPPSSKIYDSQFQGFFKVMQCGNEVRAFSTLKALANSSPGFVLKPWVQKCRKRCFATLKELRLLCGWRTATQLLQSCVFGTFDMRVPRVAKSATLGWNLRTLSALFINGNYSQRPLFIDDPGLELANAFSVRVTNSI